MGRKVVFNQRPVDEPHCGHMAAEKLQYGNYFELTARLDKADLAHAKFNPTDLPAYLDKCGTLIYSHIAAWHTLQKLLYERTVRDLTDNIDAIRQGNADVGLVMGQEARDIFANAIPRPLGSAGS